MFILVAGMKLRLLAACVRVVFVRRMGMVALRTSLICHLRRSVEAAIVRAGLLRPCRSHSVVGLGGP